MRVRSNKVMLVDATEKRAQTTDASIELRIGSHEIAMCNA